ncbi:MAG TPA: hypothetical protein VMU20_08260 [Candidatus Dormibacteraeota bacterium]|nr:hypothetical protein [Candidatus Dormibacteraeota bacterium]
MSSARRNHHWNASTGQVWAWWPRGMPTVGPSPSSTNRRAARSLRWKRAPDP